MPDRLPTENQLLVLFVELYSEDKILFLAEIRQTSNQKLDRLIGYCLSLENLIEKISDGHAEVTESFEDIVEEMTVELLVREQIGIGEKKNARFINSENPFSRVTGGNGG